MLARKTLHWSDFFVCLNRYFVRKIIVKFIHFFTKLLYFRITKKIDIVLLGLPNLLMKIDLNKRFSNLA
jgi:hypothetical protein